MALEFRIEPAAEADDGLIRDSWRHSYRASPRTARWPQEAYAIWIANHMDALLKRCDVVVARPIGDWREGVIGWLCYEQLPSKYVVHYVFVRPLFRNQGVMSALIASTEPRGEKVFSALRVPFTDALKHSGFRFDREASNPE